MDGAPNEFHLIRRRLPAHASSRSRRASDQNGDDGRGGARCRCLSGGDFFPAQRPRLWDSRERQNQGPRFQGVSRAGLSSQRPPRRRADVSGDRRPVRAALPGDWGFVPSSRGARRRHSDEQHLGSVRSCYFCPLRCLERLCSRSAPAPASDPGRHGFEVHHHRRAERFAHRDASAKGMAHGDPWPGTSRARRHELSPRLRAGFRAGT